MEYVPALLKSRRFWTLITGLISMVVVSFAPQLKEQVDALIPAIVALVVALIGGYSLEDAFLANSSKK